ncbi:hypothetical protein VCHA30O60_50154 [Vibrio chagasii]|nr:hypothetical protein VCHA30O60_50154 [Vibrio chagasii]
MPKYIAFPFADRGDKEEVPDSSVDATVSYETGYGDNYELNPDDNPEGLFLERRKWNQVLFDITENIKHWQENTFPEWISENEDGEPYSYSRGATITHGGENYYSLIDDNNTEPPSASWRVYDIPIQSVFGRTGEIQAEDGDYNASQITGFEEAVNQILLARHPIGTVLLRMDDVNPATVLGGTWDLITGDASLSLGDGTPQSGTPQGSNEQDVPLLEHSHEAGSLESQDHDHSIGHSLSTSETGNHSHGLPTYGFQDGGITLPESLFVSTSYDSDEPRDRFTASSGAHSHSVSGTITASQGGGEAITGSTGSSGDANPSMDVRGARVGVNVWQRVA